MFSWRKAGIALKFVGAVILMRLQDVVDAAWVPGDAVLRSRALSNLVVWTPFVTALLAVIRHDRLYGLVANADNLIELWGGAYAVIRVGRWWRGVKPPKHKPRRARNDAELENH